MNKNIFGLILEGSRFFNLALDLSLGQAVILNKLLIGQIKVIIMFIVTFMVEIGGSRAFQKRMF